MRQYRSHERNPLIGRAATPSGPLPKLLESTITTQSSSTTQHFRTQCPRFEAHSHVSSSDIPGPSTISIWQLGLPSMKICATSAVKDRSLFLQVG